MTNSYDFYSMFTEQIITYLRVIKLKFDFDFGIESIKVEIFLIVCPVHNRLL